MTTIHNLSGILFYIGPVVVIKVDTCLEHQCGSLGDFAIFLYRKLVTGGQILQDVVQFLMNEFDDLCTWCSTNRIRFFQCDVFGEKWNVTIEVS